MIKNAYLEREIMQIRSQTGHLFAVCLLQNGISSHCSEFILTPPVDSIIILLVHFDLIYIFYVYIKVVMQNYILVRIIIFINV